MKDVISDMSYLVGIDVGTGSARAGVFDFSGQMLAMSTSDIVTYRESGSIVEQSSQQIWKALCDATRTALDEIHIEPERVSGVGFTGTGSLVAVGEGGIPLPVGPSEEDERNIIVWMDLRSVPQAEKINATRHELLKYVGGKVSPELQLPKVLWLKENRPATFEAVWQFFDLTDFLTWRATGSLSRSTCTAACKWAYDAYEKRWDPGFYRAIGLGVLADEGFERIGTEIIEPGAPLGAGLSEQAAEDLGLRAGTPVGTGLVDAHAGGVGSLGAPDKIGSVTSRLSYVFGTSGCTLSVSQDPHFVPGVWGPYYSGMVPDLWLNEGGQSSAGSAIEHLLTQHAAYDEVKDLADQAGLSVPDWLAERALKCRAPSKLVELAGQIIVVPDFNGNRSPFADPKSRAVIAGLGFESDLENLMALYIAGLCGLAYGLRQIIETQTQNGVSTDTIVISGGAGSSDVVRQIIADATGLPVAVPSASQPVLLGAGILGAVAGSIHADVPTAMRSMSSFGSIVHPVDGDLREIHDKRFEAYCALQNAGKIFMPS